MSTIPMAKELAAKRINDKDPVWFQLGRTDLNAKSSHDVARKSYEAAVREVAEAIAVERDEYRKALEWITNNPGAHPVNILNVVSDALSKYPRP